jgi:signal transduction histidine kinase
MENPEKKETILLVDDIPANLEILIRVFQKEGYKVRAVTSGPLGIRAAEHEPPDIVLLDVTMPDMDGYEACRRLKQNPALKAIPVIFISALSETFDKMTAFEAGGVDYITKPIQIEEALARVKTHLALRRYQRLLEQSNQTLQETIDQLKEAQGQLINSEKMASLGVLTAGIAHEINNPISFISSSSIGLSKNIRFLLDIEQKYEAILTRCQEKELDELNEYKVSHDFDERLTELTQLTDNIIEGSRRISGIVRSLRQFSRLDEADMKEIDIHENIDSTLILLHHKIFKEITIKKEYQELPKVTCFPAKISQVLMNILSNAIDAVLLKTGTGQPCEIAIRTGVCEMVGNRFVIIAITDTGPGIPSETMKKIFDPFFTTKPVGKGMGLGLSISNNIVREHGGKIEVHSTPPDGTAFTVYLPLNSLPHERY